MRRLALVAPLATFCLCPAALFAGTIFDALTGLYGTDLAGETCEENPKRQSFSADHGHIRLVWVKPVPSYLGDGDITELDGRVTAFDDTSITYLRADETRTGSDGQLLLWTFHLIEGGNAYCVTSTEAPEVDCIEIARRCGNILS